MNAVDLIVEDEGWNILSGKAKLAEDALAAATRQFKDARPGVVAVLMTGDATVAELNERYRGKPGPTNVLSFPAGEGADNHLGDIALAWGVVAQEAETRGLAVADHLRHLLIHGFLHLHGYDHQTDDEAEVMETIERQALAELGVADPYAAEAGTE